MLPEKKNYIPFTQHAGYAPYFFAYGFLTHIQDLEGVIFSDGSSRKSFVARKAVQRTLEEGLRLYASVKAYQELQTATRAASADVENSFFGLKEDFSLERLEIFLDAATELSTQYRFTEFFYTERAYEQMDGNPVVRQNFTDFEDFKLEGRRMVNRLSYGNDAYMSQLLSLAAGRFAIPEATLEQYKAPELFALFEGAAVDPSILSERKLAYFLFADARGKIEEICGQEALNMISSFLRDVEQTELKGQVASKGQTKGLARVVQIESTNFASISEALKAVQEGEILVADSTIPELIPACKVVSAIITNQGGMMSHAAITSRELGIPCIVGVENATKHLRTGDLVEVDADNGVVRILERAK